LTYTGLIPPANNLIKFGRTDNFDLLGVWTFTFAATMAGKTEWDAFMKTIRTFTITVTTACEQ